MTRPDDASGADAELRDAIRSIDAIGEGASGREHPEDTAAQTHAEPADDE